jgi:predicted enzyme related to lactoylglutathione lyase
MTDIEQQPGLGKPPSKGWAALTPELLVENYDVSLKFWCEVLGFSLAYQRPSEKFAYLERTEGAQIMISQRHDNGKWELGPMEPPFGQGVMFQIAVDDIQPMIKRINEHGHAFYNGGRDQQELQNPREVWRQHGDREGGALELFVLDPNGYLIMCSQSLGQRDLSDQPVR